MRKGKPKDVRELHARVFTALKKAVAKTLTRHEAMGVPAAIWRDGKVVWLSKRRLREVLIAERQIKKGEVVPGSDMKRRHNL